MREIFRRLAGTIGLAQEDRNRLTVDMILADVPKRLREELKSEFDDLHSLRTVKDPNAYNQKHLQIIEKLKHARTYTREGGPVDRALKGYMLRRGAAGGNVFGYTPAGAKLWGHFSNPMAVFSFLYDNYWAFKFGVDLIETQVESAGFFLEGAKGLSQDKILETYKTVRDLDIDRLFVEGIVMEQKYGNFYVLPHFSATKKKKELVRLEVLYPDRMSPIYDEQTWQITGWVYTRGRSQETYTVDQVLHLHKRSGENMKLGTPPIMPAVTDIEGCLYASMLNNTIFQKGGILGAIVALDEGKNSEGGPPSPNQMNDWQNLVQETLDAHAGARGGHGMLALTNVKDVHKLAEPGTLDSNWTHGRDGTAKITLELQGVPPEKAGLVRSSALQYSPALVEDSVNQQLDDTINSLTRRHTRFWNREVFQKLLEITQVKIKPLRRSGAKTKTAAEALKTLADGGGWVSRNEGRVEWLHMEPLPGPEGQELVCTNAAMLKPDSLPPRIASENIDPDLQGLEEGKGKSGRKSQNYKNVVYSIRVGGEFDGEIGEWLRAKITNASGSDATVTLYASLK